MSVAAFAVSPDGNLLAYCYDNTGFRQYTLAVKDLRTGKTLADHAERVGSVVWANDNKTIFYTQEDAVAKRQYRLYRHAAGTTGPPTLSSMKKRTSDLMWSLQDAEPVLHFPGFREPHHE